LTACLSLQACFACDWSEPARCTGIAEVQVVDRATGEVQPLYRHAGQLWVAGVPGHAYAIRMHNATAGRVLAVVAVDGVNAVSGDTAAWNQTGYVLSPWESYDVLGWRKSQERVADFVFTALEDSYAARTGRASDVGVIGVAIFREKVALPALQPPLSQRDIGPSERREAQDGSTAPSSLPSRARAMVVPPALAAAGGHAADNAPAAQESTHSRLGTGHGPGEVAWVGSTTFERARKEPDLVISIRYDRPGNLVAMGILPGAAAPRPFPESAMLRFVPDPPARMNP
jgi:hypothetical protein